MSQNQKFILPVVFWSAADQAYLLKYHLGWLEHDNYVFNSEIDKNKFESYLAAATATAGQPSGTELVAMAICATGIGEIKPRDVAGNTQCSCQISHRIPSEAVPRCRECLLAANAAITAWCK